MSKITLFAQIIGKLDRVKFKNLVAKHQTDKQSERLWQLESFGINAVLSICQESICS